MTDARMLIIVPTRSRPENVAKVVRAWEDTDAFRHADLEFVYDMDDPKRYAYEYAISETPEGVVSATMLEEWRPLVPKIHKALNVFPAVRKHYFAIGFAGDDHLPRTHGWASRYLEALIEMGTGIVSCPDGYRNDDLPTQWAMTADIVRALGRMVPAPVEHLYCDDAIRDLAKVAECWRYLDDVLIEHIHPLAGKTKFDDQYRHVNRDEQYERDGHEYRMWRLHNTGMAADVAKVRELIKASQ